MEVIKKTIKQAVTTGATTGCTGTTCFVIVPDLTAIYNINFCLKQQIKDWGFFDPLNESPLNNNQTILSRQELFDYLGINTEGG